MSDTKQIDTSGTGAGETTKTYTKKRTCARHCKRFWWLYLIVFICIVILVVCLVIFVGVPKIAQGKLNDAKLDIEGVNILRTESDNYQLEINSTITTDGKVKAKIYSFPGDMYLEDEPSHTPFATIQFPETSGAKHQMANISQHLKIADMGAYRRFNIWFHNNEELRVTVKGRTKVKPSGLSRKSGVDFKKTLTIKGLNVFAGTEVKDGHISLTKDKNGRNFNGRANIPNASRFTLEIGNVTFNNFVEDTKVGYLYIDNLILRPGDNLVNISATMDQAKILTAVRKRPYCEKGILPFKLLGENVTNHGQDLSYFTAALSSKNQTVDIDIGSIIKTDLKTTVKCAE